MGVNRHLNWDSYRREAADVVDQYPELAVAIVKCDFPRFVEIINKEGLQSLENKLHFDVVDADIREGSTYTSHEYKYWDDEDIEVFKSIREDPIPQAKILQELKEEGYEMEWVSSYDADVPNTDFESLLSEYNSGKTNQNTITFPNKTTALIWIKEITGQISDGAWENKQWKRGSWEDYCFAEVEVDESSENVRWDGSTVDGLAITRKCTEYEGMVGRMIYYVRLYELGNNYGEDDLRDDLRKINTMERPAEI